MGLTQESLAEDVGVARSTLISWERGTTKPNGSQIILIANALGLKDMNRLIEV